MSCIIIINQFVCKLYIKTQKPNVSEDHKYGIGVKKKGWEHAKRSLTLVLLSQREKAFGSGGVVWGGGCCAAAAAIS